MCIDRCARVKSIGSRRKNRFSGRALASLQRFSVDGRFSSLARLFARSLAINGTRSARKNRNRSSLSLLHTHPLSLSVSLLHTHTHTLSLSLGAQPVRLESCRTVALPAVPTRNLERALDGRFANGSRRVFRRVLLARGRANVRTSGENESHENGACLVPGREERSATTTDSRSDRFRLPIRDSDLTTTMLMPRNCGEI